LWCVTLRHAEGPVAALLADLARRLPCIDVPLEGLAEPELAEMLERAGVGAAEEAARLAPDVAERTAGNPFFVGQLVHDALARRSSLDLAGVPGAVAQHVVRRVEALDRPRASLLVLAAIIGGDVDPALLEACATEPERVLDRLEDLTRDRFLEERAADRFGFPHAIVRDAVLATVSPTRARRLHGRVADALAAQGAGPAVVAHHYVAAGPARAADATTFLLAGGEAALARGEWSVAGEQFANAVRTAPTVGDRIAARVGLGRAQRALGDTAASRATLDDALAEARARGDGRGAALAILALVGGGGRGVAVDMPDAERTRLWREALAAIPDDDDPLAVPVLGGLALSLVLTDAVEERIALCDRAVAAARAGGDPETVASALLTRRVALMGPSGTEARLRDGEEILRAGPTAISTESRLGALLGRVEDELEMGRRAEVDRAIADATGEAERIAHPYWSWATTSWRALLAIVDGRFDDAEALAHEAFAHQAPAQHPEALAALGVNLVVIRFFQDRAGEVVDLLAAAAEESPNIPGYRAVLALAHTVTGDRQAADEAYRWFAARDFALPADSNWLIGIAGLSEAAVTLGDEVGARVLLDRLAPFEDRHLIVNVYGGGGAYWGPAAYQLARLARLTGDLEAARRWAEIARHQVAALRAESFRGRGDRLAEDLGLDPGGPPA
jgi:tetratricopeptide (TPR) repeat protein